MKFPPPEIFPTRLSPDDRFETLVAAAKIRMLPEELLGRQDRIAEHFRPEASARVVPVRLLQGMGRFERSPVELNDLTALERVTNWGFEPLSLHAFLAFLGQHPSACRNAAGTCIPQTVHVNGYACLFRFMDREGWERDLKLFPVRSLKGGYRVGLVWTELFAVEPEREDAQARVFDNDL